MDKVKVDLKNVPQTLLMPLYGRAKMSQEPYSPLHDQRAIELVNVLDYDFAHLEGHIRHLLLVWMARAYHFDQAIKDYLRTYPDAVIVNLGAGLETAFYRVDNGKLTWVDLDLPEVINLRKELLPPSDRVHSIAKSVLDYSWMNDVKQLGNHFFFFAGGLFMYLSEAQVKSLFLEMTKQFPNTSLIFDTVSKKRLFYGNEMLQKAHMQGAVMHWGIDNPQEIASWSKAITVESQMPFFKGIKNKFKFPLKTIFKMYFYDLFNKGAIVTVKFS